MEGVGSRLGRASSRYGPATVFNGPVRKWKKKWVHVSSSSSSSSSISRFKSSSSQNQGSRLLLCRWTPISSSSAAADSSSAAPEEPPRRKFRYTPIAVLEEHKKAVAKKADEEAKTNEMDQSIARSTAKSNEAHGRPDCNELVKEETKDANTNPFDSSQVGNKDTDSQLKTKTTAPFWSVN